MNALMLFLGLAVFAGLWILLMAESFRRASSSADRKAREDRRVFLERRINRGSPAPLIERRKGSDRRKSIRA